VEVVRPGRCPACDTASRSGGTVVLHGHGLRDRQVLGPPSAEAAGAQVIVLVRRYRSGACRAIVAVVPREVAPRRHYSRPAIALALGRYGLLGETPAAVRRHVSPWATVGATATGRWATLRRWARAAGRGALLCTAPVSGTARQQAARAAQVALGHAPPGVRHLSVVAQVFAGAVAMA
jgi:hypothetical protein